MTSCMFIKTSDSATELGNFSSQGKNRGQGKTGVTQNPKMRQPES